MVAAGRLKLAETARFVGRPGGKTAGPGRPPSVTLTGLCPPRVYPSSMASAISRTGGSLPGSASAPAKATTVLRPSVLVCESPGRSDRTSGDEGQTGGMKIVLGWEMGKSGMDGRVTTGWCEP